MRRAVTAELIHIKFWTLNPWLDLAIYLKDSNSVQIAA